MQNKTAIFPQVRQDAMDAFAKSFNPSAPSTAGFEYAARFDGTHWDGAESAFTARMLEYIRPGVMEIAYPQLKGQLLCPVDTSADPGAETWTVTQVDQAGTFSVGKDLESEIMPVDIKVGQFSVPLFSIRNYYSYTQQEARAAIMARVPLLPLKAMRAREQLERGLDGIIFLGNTVGGVKGLLNQASAQTYTIPNGAGGSPLWDNKSPDEILADMNGAPNQVVTTTLEIEVPDTMILPLSARNLIAGRRVGDGTSMNVMQYFLANTAFIQEIVATHKSETVGSGATRRGVVYKKDPIKLVAIVSQPFEQSPPQVFGLEVKTYCHIRTGGVALLVPKSMAYFDGI